MATGRAAAETNPRAGVEAGGPGPRVEHAVGRLAAFALEAARGGRRETSTEELSLASLALESAGARGVQLKPLRRLLASAQGDDGGVPTHPDEPGVYWSTPWAVLAWRSDPEFAAERTRALQFLLQVGSQHWPAESREVVGHDTSLRGWPWVPGTHSWVQPTSVAVLAMRAEGMELHARCVEAIAMVKDRQLPTGGWNYGNTTVLGNALRPLPEDTGYALCAIQGCGQSSAFERSLGYLENVAVTLRAPASLAWAILGLSAWRARPEGASRWVEESLALQDRVGAYPIRYLAQLVLADRARSGIMAACSGGRHDG